MRLRRLLAATAAASFAFAPAGVEVETPVFAEGVSVVGNVPDVQAISATISPSEPLMVVSTLHGLSSYDISDPESPQLISKLPIEMFENESVNMGERFIERDEGGETARYAMVGFDLYGVSPTDQTANLDYELAIVDVTDPANMEIVGRTPTPTSAHTMQCADAACSYAYTSGAYDEGFSIVDLTDPTQPTVVEGRELVASPAGSGHDWDTDAAGILWHVGTDGLAAFDVSDPENPALLNSSNEAGLNGETAYNNFILHNSFRPEGNAFRSRGHGEELAPDEERTAADIRPGEVLLVTEEDYDDPSCGTEGSFSTWHVQRLHKQENRDGTAGEGTIVPLDRWNTELPQTGMKTPAGAFCSAHYFDYHQDGFVAQGWYQQGMRILDVRDATDIKQVGYFFTGATETWAAYWVPERNEDGTVQVDEETGDIVKSDLLYTTDLVHGIDVLRFEPPQEAPADTTAVEAPVLPAWIAPEQDTVDALRSRESSQFGFACPLPGARR